MYDVRYADLRKLNTLTKYPSIETYHKLERDAPDVRRRGCLTQEVQVDFGIEDVYMTEKVNGANARIVMIPNISSITYILGSREEFLHAQGDLIIHGDPTAVAIVETLKPIAERLCQNPITFALHTATVIYGEVYGGNIGGKAARQYTADAGTYGFRIFDGMLIRDFARKLEDPIEAIAAWRQRGEQPFFTNDALEAIPRTFKLDLVPTMAVRGGGLPTTVEAMYELLQQTVGKSCCLLDSGGQGKAEGMILRNKDRTLIAKVRFEEYERTLKR